MYMCIYRSIVHTCDRMSYPKDFSEPKHRNTRTRPHRWGGGRGRSMTQQSSPRLGICHQFTWLSSSLYEDARLPSSPYEDTYIVFHNVGTVTFCYISVAVASLWKLYLKNQFFEVVFIDTPSYRYCRERNKTRLQLVQTF